jgi:competence protein ComEA
VADAVRAAGGILPGSDLGALNLARKVTDGELVMVGSAAAAEPATGSPAGTLVNLNTATAADLDALPGVGPVLAQRIVDFRREHGSFASVDQLREVTGIGDAKLEQLRDRVTV